MHPNRGMIIPVILGMYFTPGTRRRLFRAEGRVKALTSACLRRLFRDSAGDVTVTPLGSIPVQKKPVFSIPACFAAEFSVMLAATFWLPRCPLSVV